MPNSKGDLVIANYGEQRGADGERGADEIGVKREKKDKKSKKEKEEGRGAGEQIQDGGCEEGKKEKPKKSKAEKMAKWGSESIENLGKLEELVIRPIGESDY